MNGALALHPVQPKGAAAPPAARPGMTEVPVDWLIDPVLHEALKPYLAVLTNDCAAFFAKSKARLPTEGSTLAQSAPPPPPSPRRR